MPPKAEPKKLINNIISQNRLNSIKKRMNFALNLKKKSVWGPRSHLWGLLPETKF